MPGSNLLTIDMITREAVMLFRNSNKFIQNVDMQYDDQFARTGAKIGDTLRIRLPNDYTVRTGPAINVQGTNEQYTSLAISTQQGVDVGFSSVDLTLSLDDFSERILAPMINNLAGAVAINVMGGTEGGISNITFNVDGGGNIISPTADTWLNAGAILDNNSTMTMGRKVMMDPRTQARTVSSLSGLFNPQSKISEQFKTGAISTDTLGFDWYMDQSVIKHTTGSFSAGTVNGANQTGQEIVVNAITGTLAVGDIITFEDVNGVNRVFKATTGELQQFVVTEAASNGATSLSIYPAIVPPVAGNAVAFQTVTQSPANGAAISLVAPASTTYRQNFAFAPQAVTLGMADLQIPEKGVLEAARHSFDGVSMRMISDYITATDQWVTRLDVLYGWVWLRPEWACIVADMI